MTTAVEKIVDEVKSLPKAELDEFLTWLAEYELQQSDEWDKEIHRDCQPGGRLQNAILGRGKGGAERRREHLLRAVGEGIGNALGAVVGGLVLGLLEAFGAGYLSSKYKDAIAFVVLVAVLFLMPQGLFGRAKVERV